jgi:hypothetical protein
LLKIQTKTPSAISFVQWRCASWIFRRTSTLRYDRR